MNPLVIRFFIFLSSSLSSLERPPTDSLRSVCRRLTCSVFLGSAWSACGSGRDPAAVSRYLCIPLFSMSSSMNSSWSSISSELSPSPSPFTILSASSTSSLSASSSVRWRERRDLASDVKSAYLTLAARRPYNILLFLCLKDGIDVHLVC